MANRFHRATPDTWHFETTYMHRVLELARKAPTKIMFPTTHDITPGILPVCVKALELMLRAGHMMLVVSKPHIECIEALCSEFIQYRERILFRFTIGSVNDATLSFWEPHAPTFSERLDSLRLANTKGFDTSVSCEPMLDTAPHAVIAEVSPWVTDAIWLGKPNQLRQRLKLNTGGDPEAMSRADELIASQSDAWVRDLYREFRHNPQIKWKDSIKKVVGLELPAEAGLDI